MAAPMEKHELGLSEPSYCKLKHSDFGSIFGAKLSKLRHSWEIFSMCEQQHEKILSEFKFLTLSIFKRNGQLRKEKSMQLLKRIQACLKRFHVGTKLYRNARDLHQDIISAVNAVKVNAGACFLPAKQMWMFILFVLQKYVDLLKVTASYCISAYEHLSCHFSTGMLIPQMLMFMGSVSRIWLLSNGIVEKLRHMYKEIFAMLEHISRTPSQWVEPPLLPFLDKTQDEIVAEEGSSHKEMLQMSSDEPPEHLEVFHSQHNRGSWNSLGVDDEEDLGEPVESVLSRVDENSNPRKRTMDSDDTQLPQSKKRRKEDETSTKDKGKKIQSLKKKEKLKKKKAVTQGKEHTMLTPNTAAMKDKNSEVTSSTGDPDVKKKKKRKKHNSVKKSLALDSEKLEGTVKTISSPTETLKSTKKSTASDELDFNSTAENIAKNPDGSHSKKKKKKKNQEPLFIVPGETGRVLDSKELLPNHGKKSDHVIVKDEKLTRLKKGKKKNKTLSQSKKDMKGLKAGDVSRTKIKKGSLNKKKSKAFRDRSRKM